MNGRISEEKTLIGLLGSAAAAAAISTANCFRTMTKVIFFF